MTFRLLHVCTGNICRSPMAERLTRAGLAARGAADAFVVESAGTWGLSGAPMDPGSQRALAAYGLDGDDFRARQLVGYHVDEADLVLCATREHRSAAVTSAPDPAARTSTLRAPASAFTACAELVEHCLRRPLDLVAGPVAPARLT